MRYTHTDVAGVTIVDIEPQRDFGVLQVIVAVTCVGFVGAQVHGCSGHRGDRSQNQNC